MKFIATNSENNLLSEGVDRDFKLLINALIDNILNKYTAETGDIETLIEIMGGVSEIYESLEYLIDRLQTAEYSDGEGVWV